MKNIPYYIILLLISSSCTSNSSVNVKSWEEVETKTLNERIQQAYKKNKNWVNKPELYVFNLFELSDLKKTTYEYTTDNIENPNNIDIRVTRDGFLDDSVRGDTQHIKLNKGNDGKWKIVFFKKAISCWRNNNMVYSSDGCP